MSSDATSKPQSVIFASNLSKSYGSFLALDDVSFSVENGQTILLTGQAGAGKSSLIRCLSLADSFDAGSLHIAGRDISGLAAAALPYVRRQLGVIFQDLRLIRHWTARQNIAYTLELRGSLPSAVRELTQQALLDLSLVSVADIPVSRLSGGEQQCVAIARALVISPQIILADEPTGHLDKERTAQVIQLLDSCVKNGAALIVTTHDPLVAAAFGTSRQLQLVKGKLNHQNVSGMSESQVSVPLTLVPKQSQDTRAAVGS